MTASFTRASQTQPMRMLESYCWNNITINRGMPRMAINPVNAGVIHPCLPR